MPASIKPNAPFIALALITITLSSWGLFRLLVDFAACPPWFAAVAVGGVDLLAVVCGKHAIDVAGDGDSPAFWNLAMLLITGVAAWLQYAHTQLAGQPVAIGVIMAVFPVATVLLFEGRLRRAARLAGREQGKVLGPRATVPLIVWVRFPRLAWDAFSVAVLNRDLTGADVLEQAQQSVPVELPPDNLRQLTAGRPTIAAAVRDAVDKHGHNLADVLAEVRKTHEGADKDTVRRNMNRTRTNGQAASS